MTLTKRKRYWLIASVTLLLLLAAAVAANYLLFNDPPVQYLTASVKHMDIENSILATGTLKPIKQVNVGAQVNGQLKSLKVKLGERVHKGQWLAQIDPMQQENVLRKAEAALASVQANKRAAKAQLTQYQLAWQRQLTMVGSGASARAELEAALAQLEGAKANLVALDAQIKQARIEVDIATTDIGYTRILAPMDGEVISINTQEGQTVVSAQSAPTILVLANLDTMTVKAKISEADVARVTPGQQVYFTILGEPDRRFASRLHTVEPAPESLSDSNSGTGSPSNSSNSAVYYNGLFNISNPEHVLRTSMTAQVTIVQDQVKHVLAIPVTALGQQHKDGSYSVRILDNAGQPQPRIIKTGLSNNIHVQIISGLALNDKVIIDVDTPLLAGETTNSVGVTVQ